MLIRKICFFLGMMIYAVSANATATAAPAVEQWQLTSAQITLVKDNIKGLETNDPVLNPLLKQNKRSLWSMKEEDGSLLSLAITYKVVGKDTPVTQIGLYRTFDKTIQRILEAKGLFRKPITFDIVYLKNSPLTIRFYIKGNLVPMPPLLPKE